MTNFFSVDRADFSYTITARFEQEENEMKVNTSKNIMKGIGATLAVCSALAMASSSKGMGMGAKKAVKKTADKVADMVSTLSSFM